MGLKIWVGIGHLSKMGHVWAVLKKLVCPQVTEGNEIKTVST